VLARDKACFDVRVSYRVITGGWAYDEARKAAIRDNRDKWGKMPFEEREALVNEYLPEFEEQLEGLWQTLARVGGIGRAEVEERKTAIKEKVQKVRAHNWGKWRKERSERLGRSVDLDEVAGEVREERMAHTLLEALPDEPAYELQAEAEKSQWPGLDIERSRLREHPENFFHVGLKMNTLPSPIRKDEDFWVDVDQVAVNLLGSLRDTWSGDVERRPFMRPDGSVDLGGYRDGDSVGSDGIESAEEDRLRGLRGQMLIHRDTQQVERRPATVGADVHLTIDAALQARILAIMNTDPHWGLMRVQQWHENKDTPVGTELYGSALVMDVDSGELLALVSTPVAPPEKPGEPYPDLALDPNDPLYLKPLQAAYPPGSTIKPIMYAMAATARRIEIDQQVSCEGHLFPNDKTKFRCWGYRPELGPDHEYVHGTLGPVEAIARSCNIYFYTCGRRLGPVLLHDQLAKWGVGVPTLLGLPGESQGTVAPTDPGEATMVGIGQGPIAVPPIQVAIAHAALARGGYYRSPLLIRERARDRAEEDLHLPPQVVRNVLQGMHDAANASYGTAAFIRVPDKERIFNFPDVTLRAKTGTATAPRQYARMRTTDELGKEIIVADRSHPLREKADHSWYILHVQKPGTERAAYIIVVMVEYGGSGGKVSGPIANQVLYALKDEGYL
jgi:penicillin-binding protein 2